jgi:hypothetical protein
VGRCDRLQRADRCDRVLVGHDRLQRIRISNGRLRCGVWKAPSPAVSQSLARQIGARPLSGSDREEAARAGGRAWAGAHLNRSRDPSRK